MKKQARKFLLTRICLMIRLWQKTAKHSIKMSVLLMISIAKTWTLSVPCSRIYWAVNSKLSGSLMCSFLFGSCPVSLQKMWISWQKVSVLKLILPFLGKFLFIQISISIIFPFWIQKHKPIKGKCLAFWILRAILKIRKLFFKLLSRNLWQRNMPVQKIKTMITTAKN